MPHSHKINATGLKHLREAVTSNEILVGDRTRRLAAAALARSNTTLRVDSRDELEAVMRLTKAAQDSVFRGRPSWRSLAEDLVAAARRQGAGDLAIDIFPGVILVMSVTRHDARDRRR